jgi:carbamate kinase
MRSYNFPAGSMGPKVQAAIQFVERTGKRVAIGALKDIEKIVAGEAGTNVSQSGRNAQQNTNAQQGVKA